MFISEGTSGFIMVTANGGINQQRVAVCLFLYRDRKLQFLEYSEFDFILAMTRLFLCF